MKFYVQYEENEKANSFSYAEAFCEALENVSENIETVAKMMLLRAQELKGLEGERLW